MLEVFRDQDQHTLGAARQQLAMDHHAGFDGFAQAHFVREQNARGDAVGDFTGDMQLVRDGLRAHAAQAPQRGGQLFALVFQGVVAQLEPVQRVDLAGEQAIAGEAELDEVRQLGFWQGAGFALCGQTVIDQQAVDILDFAHGHLPAFEVRDFITRDEAHTGQRSAAGGVLAGFAGGGVEHGEHAAVLHEDGSQTEFRFAVADPALPR